MLTTRSRSATPSAPWACTYAASACYSCVMSGDCAETLERKAVPNDASSTAFNDRRLDNGRGDAGVSRGGKGIRPIHKVSRFGLCGHQQGRRVPDYEVLVGGSVGADERSTSIVQSVTSAVIVAMAATTGASRTPTTPNVNGNSAPTCSFCLIRTRRTLPSSMSSLTLSTTALPFASTFSHQVLSVMIVCDESGPPGVHPRALAPGVSSRYSQPDANRSVGVRAASRRSRDRLGRHDCPS